MARADEALQIIQAIYDVPLGNADWPWVLQKISEASEGHSGILRLVDCRRTSIGFVAAHGYDLCHLEDYRQHFVHLDPYREHLAAAPTGALLQSDQVVPLTTRQHTEYFNDYERHGDRYHALGSPLGREQDFLLYLGLSRGQRAGPYDQGTLDFIRSLLPHMLRAVQLQRLINHEVDARRVSEATLEQLRIGVILLDTTRCVRFANSAALDIAQTYNIAIGMSGIALPGSVANQQLQRLINGALATNYPNNQKPGGELTYSQPGTGIIQIRVFPLPLTGKPRLLSENAQVAIFLVHPGPAKLNASQIAVQFGLTAAESRLATQLVEGQSVEEAAKISGIAIATARTHLRNIFAKTATSRQSELVLLLMTSLAGLSSNEQAEREN